MVSPSVETLESIIALISNVETAIFVVAQSCSTSFLAAWKLCASYLF